MKKFLKSLVGFATLVCIVLAGAETEDGGICLPWFFGFLAASVAGILIIKWMDHERGRRR